MCVCVCVCVCVNTRIRLTLHLFVLFSDETRQALLEWNRHDDEADRFCMHDGNLAGEDGSIFMTLCLLNRNASATRWKFTTQSRGVKTH